MTKIVNVPECTESERQFRKQMRLGSEALLSALCRDHPGIVCHLYNKQRGLTHD